jgi:hypothetical protein
MPVGLTQTAMSRAGASARQFRNRKDCQWRLVNDDVFHGGERGTVRHRQMKVRFDFRRDLITEIHEPSAEERQRLL